MNATSAAREASDAAAYEQVRSSALAGSTSASGSHYGLVLLMREGVASFLARLSPLAAALETPQAPGVAAEPGRAPLAMDEFHASVVHVLANMALAATMEIGA